MPQKRKPMVVNMSGGGESQSRGYNEKEPSKSMAYEYSDQNPELKKTANAR